MDVIECIYNRRSIRKFKADPVPVEMINKLLETATLAPSSSNSQPWSFVVIQDVNLLKEFSDRSKAIFLEKTKDNASDPYGYRAKLSKPDFNIFYNASTLITIYANSKNKLALGDCCLAAQNLMIAANSLGLGSCWIGFAEPLLDSADLKKELGIPPTYYAVSPMILGYPAIIPTGYSRKAPEILFWK
ncbi:MAG: nitroreductase family protein [Firmicutes bacterium HGW-Firmicutes-12]|jgi:nitroreductase|nr:MAG: nitroreductase family protein [Firmicutes bacterium HGW-Firmicutes-12]